MTNPGEKRPRPSLIRRVVTIVLSVGVNKLLRRVGSITTRRRRALLANDAQVAALPGSQSQRLVPQVRVAASYLRSHPGVVVGVVAAGLAVVLAWRAGASGVARSR